MIMVRILLYILVQALTGSSSPAAAPVVVEPEPISSEIWPPVNVKCGFDPPALNVGTIAVGSCVMPGGPGVGLAGSCSFQLKGQTKSLPCAHQWQGDFHNKTKEGCQPPDESPWRCFAEGHECAVDAMAGSTASEDRLDHLFARCT